MAEQPPEDRRRPVPQFATETRVITDPGVRGPEAAPQSAPATPLPENMRVFFEVTAASGGHELCEMRKPIVILGRADGVADILIDDAAASRYHASVAYSDGRFVLTDMGSTNGTRHNGERVAEAELHHGDKIRIGETVIIFGVLKYDPTE